MLIKTFHWNIGGGKIRKSEDDPMVDGAYRNEGFEYIKKVIKKENPDIVTLVETHADSLRIQAEQISKELGFSDFRNEIYAHSHVEEGQELGFAVISKFPILTHSCIMYKNPGFLYRKSGKVAHDKGVLKCILSVGDKELEVVATHLVPFHRVNVKPTTAEATAHLKEVAEKIMPTKETVLVQGDFNIDSPSLRNFLPSLFDVGIQEIAVNNPTTPAYGSPDHVLYRNLENKTFKIISDVLTDHFPLYSEFEL